VRDVGGAVASGTPPRAGSRPPCEEAWAGACASSASAARVWAQGVVRPLKIDAWAPRSDQSGARLSPVWRRAVKPPLSPRGSDRMSRFLIDSWGFTLRVAIELSAHRPRPDLIKYVAPTRSGRHGRTGAEPLRTPWTLCSPSRVRCAFLRAAKGLPGDIRRQSGLEPELLEGRPGPAARHHGSGAPKTLLFLVLPGSRQSEIDRMLRNRLTGGENSLSERSGLRVVVARRRHGAGTGQGASDGLVSSRPRGGRRRGATGRNASRHGWPCVQAHRARPRSPWRAPDGGAYRLGPSPHAVGLKC